MPHDDVAQLELTSLVDVNVIALVDVHAHQHERDHVHVHVHVGADSCAIVEPWQVKHHP